MRAMPGGDMINHLCTALGLKETRVTRITIDAEWNKFPAVTVTRLADGREMKDAAKVLEQYDLVPRDASPHADADASPVNANFQPLTADESRIARLVGTMSTDSPK